MKCRHVDGIIGFLVLILIASGSGEEKFQRRENYSGFREENDIFQNAYDSFDSFPDEDFTDVNHHKIVKKQMDEITRVGVRTKRSNDETFLASVHSLQDGRTKGLRREKKSRLQAPDDGLKARSRKSRDDDQMEGHARAICKLPDKSNCHYYFECEIEPNGCMRMVRKRCPGDQTFSLKHRECIHLSYRKGLCREKRQSSCFFRGSKCPEPPPEGDAEPANEWLDAPQGTGQKIPSEFKPKPKLRLRIYHLRCKKKVQGMPALLRTRQKRRILLNRPSREMQKQLIHRTRAISTHHNVHRHHPRSFVVRLNKKPSDQEEGLSEDNEIENEEDDEDEDEEDDEESDEDREEGGFLGKNEEERLNCKEGLKDLFKSAKEAVAGKAKNGDSNTQFRTGSLQMQSQLGGKQFMEKNHDGGKKFNASPEDQDQDSTNKVLIDANIKVDEEISSALKNILSKGMNKKISKKFSEPLIGEISYKNEE